MSNNDRVIPNWVDIHSMALFSFFLKEIRESKTINKLSITTALIMIIIIIAHDVIDIYTGHLIVIIARFGTALRDQM